MQVLLAKIRRVGFIIILGVCLIIYIGLGSVYLQQGPKQKDLEEQIMKTMVVVNKPLPSIEELQAKYDDVNEALAPIEIPEALRKLVGIAEKSGIDVSPEGRKFQINPPGKPGKKKIGEGTYQVITFSNIKAQGDFDAVMNFVADLDKGATLKTMILEKADFKWVQLNLAEEEVARRAEFSAVIQAVAEMMSENDLDAIPQPVASGENLAVNDMAAFPDVATTVQSKDYTGAGEPRDGYLLCGHDRIIADNTTEYETVSYIDIPFTEYYYTCEEDGSVRQFDGPAPETATEYMDSEEVVFETVATVSVAIYTRPSGG
ncbi:MAG: hypothetical protein WBC50_05025 [Dehalococcoidales bacterium]